jgi:hypothetical protein
MMLFDMESDRAEQRDVAAQNPEVVARLKKLFDAMNAQVPKPALRETPPANRRIRRLTGGKLEYDHEPAAAVPGQR